MYTRNNYCVLGGKSSVPAKIARQTVNGAHFLQNPGK